MDQRTRMVTVLVVLACGMTSTAALLSWMDPSWPAEPQKLTQDQLRKFARAIVCDSTVIDAGRWQTVDISTREHDPGAMMAAVAAEHVHFIVHPDGRVVRSRGWIAQQVFEVSPNAVRVELAMVDADERMSVAQWASLQALTDAIHEAIGPRSAPLPVNMDGRLLSAWSAGPRSEPVRRIAG